MHRAARSVTELGDVQAALERPGSGNEERVTHKHQNGRGSLWVDRIFRDVGRIRRATGTNDKDVFKAIDTMLTQLYQQGRFDLLESLRDKKLSLMEVYADWRVKGVERLPSAATLGPVIPRWEKWTATLEAEHRRVAAGWGKKVMSQHLPDGAAIRALPDAVRAIQDTFAAQAALSEPDAVVCHGILAGHCGTRQPAL